MLGAFLRRQQFAFTPAPHDIAQLIDPVGCSQGHLCDPVLPPLLSEHEAFVKQR